MTYVSTYKYMIQRCALYMVHGRTAPLWCGGPLLAVALKLSSCFLRFQENSISRKSS